MNIIISCSLHFPRDLQFFLHNLTSTQYVIRRDRNTDIQTEDLQ
jgi:hypothetical protein